MYKSFPFAAVCLSGMHFVIYTFSDVSPHPLFAGYAVSYVEHRPVFVSLPSDPSISVSIILSGSARLQRRYNIFVPSEKCWVSSLSEVRPLYSRSYVLHSIWQLEEVRCALLRGCSCGR